MTDNKDTIDEIKNSPSEADGRSYSRTEKIKLTRLETISTADDQVNLSEPSSQAHSQYLYNKVHKTDSGYLKEIDDTPGAERILEMHGSGTFFEIHPDGTRVLRVYGDNFEIALSDNNLVVGGNLNITVQGDANILTKGNVKQKVGGDYELKVHGNMTTRVEGTRLDYTKGNQDIQTASKLRIRSEGTTDMFAGESYTVQTTANFVFDCTGTSTYYSGGAYKLSCASTLQIKSSGTMGLQSSSTVYVDGSTVQLNQPGPSISITNPSTNDPIDKDPGGGLIVCDSVTEPSSDALKILKFDNNDLVSIINTDITFPKDRTELS